MSKRSLVVEDQPDTRRIISDILAPTDYEPSACATTSPCFSEISELENWQPPHNLTPRSRWWE